MKIIFREYKKKEKEEIKNMLWALNKEDSEELPLNKKKIEDLFLHAQIGKNVKIFICEGDGKIIGYAIFDKCFGLEYGGLYGEIDELFLLPKYRNQKIGTKFIHWIENYARKSKYKSLYIGATWKNKRVQKLYKNLGFLELPRMSYIKLF